MGKSVGIIPSTTRFPLRQKLLEMAANSQAGNVYTRTPLILPSAWTTATLYSVAGIVVTNGGNMYQLNVADGSNTSSVAPTGTDPLTPVLNAGTNLVWRYIGKTNPTASAFDIPTITHFNGAPGGSLTNAYNATTDPTGKCIQVEGCSICVAQGNQFYRPIGTINGVNKSGNIWSGSGGTYGASTVKNRFTFVTDAPIVAITNAYPQAVRVIVDGVPLTQGVIVCGTGSGLCGMKLDWSATSLRKRRVYTIEYYGGASFGGVYVDTGSVVEVPDQALRIKATFIMDSYGAGGNNFPSNPGQSWPGVAGEYLGWNDVHISGIGGTGISNAGSFVNYTSRMDTDAFFSMSSLTATLSANSATQVGSTRLPDIIVICGSVNDIDAGTLATDTLALYNQIRAKAGFSTIPIIWTGICQVPQNAAGKASTNEKIMFDALPTTDQNLFLIPICDTTRISPVWLAGTGHDGFPYSSKLVSGNGVNDTYCSGDLVHMNEDGHRYIGYRFAEAVKSIVIPNLWQ